MAAILDFTYSAMTKVRSGHTRMSDIFDNIMVRTRIMLVLLFCRKRYQVIVLPCRNGAILDFIHNAMSKVGLLYYYITMSGIAEARMLDIKIKNLRLFCRK